MRAALFAKILKLQEDPTLTSKRRSRCTVLSALSRFKARLVQRWVADGLHY